MCDEATGLPVLKNAGDMNSETIVVVKRGECTFGEKALVAHRAGASGILFINNEDGLFHPSGPEAQDLSHYFSAFMITEDDGRNLIHALRRVAESTGPDLSLQGRFVPMICWNSSHNYCEPTHPADNRFETHLDYYGVIYTDDYGGKIDPEILFVQGYFGSWLDPFANWTTMVPSVIGGDANCCDHTGFEGNKLANTTAMLCLRGECDFITKAENVAAAGAGMMIVSSHNGTLTRMGCDPPVRGRMVNVASIMVSKESYEELVSHFFSQKDIGRVSRLSLNQEKDFVCEDQHL